MKLSLSKSSAVSARMSTSQKFGVRVSRGRIPFQVKAFSEADAKKNVKDFLSPWDAKLVDKLTAPVFMVTHKVKGKQDTLAIVEKPEFLKRVEHIKKAMPDFSWNYKEDSAVVDIKALKAKVTLRKSGCHTGDPFGPPGTGLTPVKASNDCFITQPFTAFIKFDSTGKIVRFDLDQYIEEVGPHGIYKKLTDLEVNPLGTYGSFSMDEALLNDRGLDA